MTGPQPAGGRDVSRRAFLGAASVAALAAAPAPARPTRPTRAPKPRNLIFMVSDGMSAGTLTLADLMLSETAGRRSRWLDLIANPDARRTAVETASANSLVTDSAAASTAWGIGERVFNGAIGVTPDGRRPEPLLHRARRAGKATGLVTTATLSHATPAGWACNVEKGRGDEPAIARQMAERRYDLLLGGGRRFFTDAVLDANGDAARVFTRDDLLALPPGPGRLVGLFARSHMRFEIDRTDEQPSLAEMTRVALDRLSRHPDGFVVQIEGGRVDHAAHMNDAGALVREQIAYDDALGVALDFASARADTLLITTTDHANANPGLTEYLSSGARRFLRLAEWRRSFEWINARLGEDPSPEDLRRVILEATTVELNDDELALVTRWRSGRTVIPFRSLDKDHGPLGSVLANHNAVSFVSGNHTADLVEQTAIGPGAERMPPLAHLSGLTATLADLLDLSPAIARMD